MEGYGRLMPKDMAELDRERGRQAKEVLRVDGPGQKVREAADKGYLEKWMLCYREKFSGLTDPP